MWKIAPGGERTQVYPPDGSIGLGIVGFGGDPFAIDREGNLYCVNSRQSLHCQILRITPVGRVTSFAGDLWGFADGRGDAARLGSLHGSRMIFGPDGTLYLTDDLRCVRKVAPDGTVTTVAGGPETGFADGRGAEARFDGAAGLAIDDAGNLLVAEFRNRRIRKISPEGEVTTLAGEGDRDSASGEAEGATFELPWGVAVGPAGDAFVLDYAERGDGLRVRKISRSGEVTTVATID